VRRYNFLSKFDFFNHLSLNIICVAVLLVITLSLVRVVYSAQVTLEWEASSDPDDEAITVTEPPTEEIMMSQWMLETGRVRLLQNSRITKPTASQ
jgi:hypothetical protein